MKGNAMQGLKIKHIDTEDGCDVVVEFLPEERQALPAVHVVSLGEMPTKRGPSNDELIAGIIKRFFSTTVAEREALWRTWTDMSWANTRKPAITGAVVGGNADDGAFDGAFTLLVGGASANAYTPVGACLAVLARDSRSESGPFTDAHYEVLTRPWRRVIGAVHPDDTLPTGTDVK